MKRIPTAQHPRNDGVPAFSLVSENLVILTIYFSVMCLLRTKNPKDKNSDYFISCHYFQSIRLLFLHAIDT